MNRWQLFVFQDSGDVFLEGTTKSCNALSCFLSFLGVFSNCWRIFSWCEGLTKYFSCCMVYIRLEGKSEISCSKKILTWRVFRT